MTMQYDKGLRGEAQAEAYLTSLGMQCIARRFRAQDGEIDLIMLDGSMLVFVEVKARSNQRRGAGLMAVTPAKQKRMAHAAADFLTKREWNGCQARFDVVEITSAGVLHIPNAFQPG